MLQSHKNKKAISEIVSYVLIIVISLSLAVGVFSWMKLYIKEPPKQCSEDVALVIYDYVCNSSTKIIEITLENRGLFDVDGFIIHASNKPDATEASMNLNLKEVIFSKPLSPEEKMTKEFRFAQLGNITLISIEPVKIIDEKRVACQNAFFKQKIKC
ncbi:hypothetical protein COV15_00365 [Candidatus Woesearchaeota archaeon CG10_big_fil_rev_8_21_14_0_10_34_12]|nr:MAG: hypothetical protein COV15_00365 [Candidatus Woesearchaeota archaeon CG10_big_fil_rev_8_21_14_0_10_34_12]